METTNTYYRTTVYLTNGTVIIKDFATHEEASDFRHITFKTNHISDSHLNVIFNPSHIVGIEIRQWNTNDGSNRKAYLESAFWVKNPKGSVRA